MATSEQSRRELNPAVSILSWLFLALVFELAAPDLLAWLSVPALILLANREAVHRFVRLLWKARWLWLALVAIYAWTVPGTLLWSSEYSPTQEGLEAGLIRVARLVLLLAALARLLAEFSSYQLAAGIYLLAKPLSLLGLDRRALAVRIALTLDQLERREEKHNWWEELKSTEDLVAGPDEIRISIAQIGLREVLMLCITVMLLGIVLVRVAA